MSCPSNEILSRYYDGEASGEEVSLVEAHLGDCAVCRGELAGYERVSLAFRGGPVLSLSAAARGRILDSVGMPSWVRMILPVARPFAAAAVILMAVGIPVLLSSEAGASGGAVQTEAKAVPLTWETQAIAPDSDLGAGGSVPAAESAQYANWVVADLSVGGKSK